MTNEDKGTALDWDDAEVSDEGGFELLPDGLYPFMVEDLKKERFPGSAKMGPCPKAALELKVLTDAGWKTVHDNIFLSTKSQWRIARFFEGLGYAKNPETGRVPMRWNEVVGKQGWLKLGHREYTSQGQQRTVNEVQEYLKPKDWPDASAAAQPSQPEQQSQQPAQAAMPIPPQPAPRPQRPDGYTPGSF